MLLMKTIKTGSEKTIDQIEPECDIKKIDLFELFVKDLFEYRHPHLYKKSSNQEYAIFRKKYKKNNDGIWVYYPWLKEAYKVLKEEDFLEVFTSRNKPYVSEEEQKNFYNFNIGIVGLSVGQSSALILARSGGCKNIKIADPDEISPSNLNRLHLGIPSVGKNKTEQIYREMLQINPFMNIQTYEDGLTDNNIFDFFTKGFKLNAIVDACDNFPIKMKIREHAKKNKIPVIMATDLGDGSLIDIERYDLNSNIKPFGDRHLVNKDTANFLKTAIAVISPENIPFSLQERFFQIGQTAPTHPQLANSVFFSGALVSYITRCISNNREIVDDRVLINFDELFDPKYKDSNFKKIKHEKTLVFKNLLGLE